MISISRRNKRFAIAFMLVNLLQATLFAYPFSSGERDISSSESSFARTAAHNSLRRRSHQATTTTTTTTVGKQEERQRELTWIRSQKRISRGRDVPKSYRIVNGTTAENYPFFVLWGGCGATLIHNDIALSAAHCSRAKEAQIGPERRNNSSNHWANVVRVQNHPRYNSETYHYDFAVLKLSGWFQSEQVRLNGSGGNPSTGDSLRILGFGGQSSTLQQGDVETISSSSCASQWRRAGYSIDEDSVICATSDEGVLPCTGDSGGPLLSSSNPNVQVGVISSGSDCDGRLPGIYSRVSAAKDWIERQICELSDFPPEGCPGGGGPGGTETIRIDIHLDDYPRDIRWKILASNSNSEEVASGGDFETPNSLESRFVYLPSGAYYDFIIEDVGGFSDGLGSSGRYSVVLVNSKGNDKKTLVSGGSNFQESESTTFLIGNVPQPPPPPLIAELVDPFAPLESEASRVAPTDNPKTVHSDKPTTLPPTKYPTLLPTEKPTAVPTDKPTALPPTKYPTILPTEEPTAVPTYKPTNVPPTKYPTFSPTEEPTNKPTETRIPPTTRPTSSPTDEPTGDPTDKVTEPPTEQPTTEQPTVDPTASPKTNSPTRNPTDSPTIRETTSDPTLEPTLLPTFNPTRDPTTIEPTEKPTREPTVEPTETPETPSPTKEPTVEPTVSPTEVVTTDEPTTAEPTTSPTEDLTDEPTEVPSSSSTPGTSAVQTLDDIDEVGYFNDDLYFSHFVRSLHEANHIPTRHQPSFVSNPSSIESVSESIGSFHTPTDLPTDQPSVSLIPSVSTMPSISAHPIGFSFVTEEPTTLGTIQSPVEDATDIPVLSTPNFIMQRTSTPNSIPTSTPRIDPSLARSVISSFFKPQTSDPTREPSMTQTTAGTTMENPSDSPIDYRVDDLPEDLSPSPTFRSPIRWL